MDRRTRSTSPVAASSSMHVNGNDYGEQGSNETNGALASRRGSKMTTESMKKEGITPLMLECQQGRSLDVQHILRRKKDAIREQTRTKKVALHFCAEGGSVACLDFVFEAAPGLLNAQDEEGYTPIHLSVINGNKHTVKALIDFQADLNCVDNEGHSLIHWATVCGELEILDLLLNSGAPAATPDIHHAHPLHYAAQLCGAIQSDSRTVRVQSTVYGVSPKKGLAILRRLLQHRVPVDVKDHDGRQPLLWAASAGSADAILALVNAGAAVEAEDKDGLTALHCAASRGHVDCIENLIALCGAEVDVIDNNGCTALFYAVTLGHADCTELLLSFGSEPNRQDRKGRTPAHCGASKGQLETIKLFAKHGGNLWLRNVRGDLPLHEAVLSRRKDLVMWLLSQRPDTVNAANHDGRCPIHLAALNNNVEMVKILIDHHAEMNGLMRTGKGTAMTPLDAAIHRGNAAVAKFLQLHGGLPSNSLNDASLQRRTNRSVSQARTISSLHGSQMGSHPEFSPDNGHLHNFTSPEMFSDANTGRPSRLSVVQYANQVAEAIVKEGPYIASITPIVDDGVQTDNSFYHHDIQVQVSDDFPNNENDLELFNTKGSYLPLRSSTSSSSKSGKKLRKKKTASSKSKSQQENTNASTESEPEHVVSKRSHSKGSIHSKAKKNGGGSSSSPPQDPKMKPDEALDQATPTTTTESSNTITQQQEESASTSLGSEKFSELENVVVGSSGDSEVRDEDLGIIEEDSGEGLMKAVTALNELGKEIYEAQADVIHETKTKGASAEGGRSQTQGSDTKDRLSARRSARSADSIHSIRSGERSRSSSRAAGHAETQVAIYKRSPTSEMVHQKNAINRTQTFPAPMSFIRNPSQEDAANEMFVIDSLMSNELNLQEAAAARSMRRRSESKSVSSKSKASTSGASASSRKDFVLYSKPEPKKPAVSIYNSSGRVATPKRGTGRKTAGKGGTVQTSPRVGRASTKSQLRLPASRTTSKSKSRDSSEEVRLQEELLALNKNGVSRESISASRDTRVNKGRVSQSSEPLLGDAKGADSGYSDQVIHTTSASEDQLRLTSVNSLPKSHSNGVLVRRGNRRPGSSSSAKIAARQKRMVASPKSGSRSTTTRERKRYEATQKSILLDIDDGVNGSEETTSHGGSGSLTSEDEYRRRQIAMKKKTTSRKGLTFSKGEDVTSGRSSPKQKNLNFDTPISVTQAMQSSMRKYNIERKIFQELLELKRLQIRSGKANEQMLVKRLADSYKKDGFSVNFRDYDGPFTYLEFEKYLYDQLRLLQSNKKLLPRFAPSDDLEKLSSALKKMNATKLPYLLDEFDGACDDANCTHLTHRCHHAAHAYTGVPCAAYIGATRKAGFLPQMNPHKAPGPVPKTGTSKPGSTIPITPSPGMTMIVSPRRSNTQSPITLEIQQGDKTQKFALPSQSLDPTKNYYVSLSIKPSPSPPLPDQEHAGSPSNGNNNAADGTIKRTGTSPKPDNLNNHVDSSNANTNSSFNEKNVDESFGRLIGNEPNSVLSK